MNKQYPARIQLDRGTYYWCRCGKSSTGPLCDGSHKGTGKEPVRFEVAEKRQVGLCNCGCTKKPPFCDGAHFCRPRKITISHRR